MLCSPGEKATAFFNLTKQAVEILGLEEEVQLVTDKKEFPKYSVLDPPALVIDGNVVFEGKIPSLDAIKDLLLKS